MPRIALINMTLGFFIVATAACCGAFLATDITTNFISDPEQVNSWRSLLEKSAHGHTNLFGILHIVFGLTIPYSQLSLKMKKLQTAGLLAGTIAMSVGLFIMAALEPSTDVNFMGIMLGTFLSCSLASIFSHGYGLLMKTRRKTF